MKTLNERQLKATINAIASRGIHYPQYKVEFFDHITTIIESEMNNGQTFDLALQTVLSTYEDNELERLLFRTTDPILQQGQYKRFANKLGMIGGMLICLWFATEYFVGIWTGVKELGGFYGLLSEVILIAIIVASTKQLRKLLLPNTLSFGLVLKFNLRVVTITTLIVLAFAPFYTYLINPQLYGIYDHQVGPITEQITLATTIGMVIGTMAEGLLISSITSLVSRFSKN